MWWILILITLFYILVLGLVLYNLLKWIFLMLTNNISACVHNELPFLCYTHDSSPYSIAGLIYSLEKSQVYLTLLHFAELGLEDYYITYFYSWYGYRSFFEFVISSRDVYELCVHQFIYWSPLYHYVSNQIASFIVDIVWNSTSNLYSYLYSLIIYFIFIIVFVYFGDAFITIESLSYTRIMFLFISLLLLFIVVYYIVISNDKFDKLEGFNVLDFLNILVSLVKGCLNSIPSIIDNLFCLLVNFLLCYSLFDVFGYTSIYYHVFLSYMVVLLIWRIIVLLLSLFELNEGKLSDLSGLPSIFFIPTGTFLLYLWYSIIWWVVFIWNSLFYPFSYVISFFSDYWVGEFHRVLFGLDISFGNGNIYLVTHQSIDTELATHLHFRWCDSDYIVNPNFSDFKLNPYELYLSNVNAYGKNIMFLELGSDLSTQILQSFDLNEISYGDMVGFEIDWNTFCKLVNDEHNGKVLN